MGVSRRPGATLARFRAAVGRRLVPAPRRGCAAALLALVAAGFVLLAEPGRADPTVILISLDGTQPADLASVELPALARMGAEGARAERMIPVFPTNTFPNHVTLVTGVGPERHGIVNNVFVDPERGRYSYESDPTWLQAEPLWSIVEGHGVPSASFHWVGSEGPWRSGRGPSRWKPFSSRTGEAEKVDQILAWLDLPSAERPRLVTAWFHGADGEGHRHGPHHPKVREALRGQDRQLGRLLDGLAAAGRLDETTLLVVSDHGMHAIERKVDLQGAFEEAGVGGRVHGGGGFVTVTLEGAEGELEAAERELERALGVAHGLGLEAWPRGRGPAGLETRNPRFGDLVVLAPVGTAISRAGLLGRLRFAMRGGTHGYRPEEPSMSAIFLAVGRRVAPGARLGEVRALDVAPTVLELLGLPVPDAMEGSPIPLAAHAARRPVPGEVEH